jgi:orotate phosphoribosyltransferase
MPPAQLSARQALDELYDLLREQCLSYGDFVLTSGRHSNYYYNGKRVTLSPRGALLVGRVLFEMIRGKGIEAVGGTSIGADPMVTAVAIASEIEGDPLPAFIVRKEQKQHGTRESVAEAFSPDSRPLLTTGRTVAIVDDAITTGGSLFEAIEAAEALGCKVGLVLALVDRHEGGADAIRARGYEFAAPFGCDPSGELHMETQLLG